MKKQIADLPDIVSQDQAYQNAMKHSDSQNARAESDRATMDAILATMSTGVELYKAVHENDLLRKWIFDIVFNATYVPRESANAARRTVYKYPTEPVGVQKVAEPDTTYGGSYK